MKFIEQTWHCPHCKTKNVDVPAWTQFPTCKKCGNDFAWYELNALPVAPDIEVEISIPEIPIKD